MTHQNSNPKPTLRDKVANRLLDQRLAQLEAELAPTLRDFRSASAAYADREQSLLPSTGKPANWQTGNWKPKTAIRRRWLLTATAACALLLFAGILGSFATKAPSISSSGELHGLTAFFRRIPKPAPAPATQTADISDEALLENVASDLSTSVPTPLQSLAPQQTTSTTATVTQ